MPVGGQAAAFGATTDVPGAYEELLPPTTPDPFRLRKVPPLTYQQKLEGIMGERYWSGATEAPALGATIVPGATEELLLATTLSPTTSQSTAAPGIAAIEDAFFHSPALPGMAATDKVPFLGGTANSNKVYQALFPDQYYALYHPTTTLNANYPYADDDPDHPYTIPGTTTSLVPRYLFHAWDVRFSTPPPGAAPDKNQDEFYRNFYTTTSEFHFAPGQYQDATGPLKTMPSPDMAEKTVMRQAAVAGYLAPIYEAENPNREAYADLPNVAAAAGGIHNFGIPYDQQLNPDLPLVPQGIPTFGKSLSR
jgi:hypothetical protein